MNKSDFNLTNEFKKNATSGWLALGIFVVLGLVLAIYFINAIRLGEPEYILPAVPVIGIFFFLTSGLFTLQPNMSAVMTLFGEYKGTVKQDGFHYVNPFYKKKKLSLRANNLNGEIIKVNDNRGNPIEIATVVV